MADVTSRAPAPPLPPRTPFQRGMHERLAAILACTSATERAFLEAQLAAYIREHASGRLPIGEEASVE